jgi:hypothetical protein
MDPYTNDEAFSHPSTAVKGRYNALSAIPLWEWSNVTPNATMWKNPYRILWIPKDRAQPTKWLSLPGRVLCQWPA